MSGYNVLVPDICREVSPEITLPVLDALQAMGNTPVVMSMRSIASMYQDYRYAKHACYEVFGFYFQELMREGKIDFGFCTGLIGVFEDVGKQEAHNLLEECGIPGIFYLHCRDSQAALRLAALKADSWKHTFIACSSLELTELLQEQGVRNCAYCPPGTSLRIFYPADAHSEQHPYPILAEDERLCRGFDVSFAGSFSPGREALLAALAGSGVSLAVFGDGAWASSGVAGSYRGEARYLTELNTVYNHSKISLDLPHDSCEFDSYLSCRVFDCLASRSLLATYRRKRFPELLDPEHELATYEDATELVQLVRYYLSDDLARHALAARGYYKVKAGCAWVKRLEALMPRLELHVLTTG